MADDLAAQYAQCCIEITAAEDARSQCDVRINAITADQEALLADYQARDAKMSADRLTERDNREKLSRQIENLKKIRDSLGVQKQVADHVAQAAAAVEAAKANEAKTAESLARAQEAEKKFNELLAKAEAPKE